MYSKTISTLKELIVNETMALGNIDFTATEDGDTIAERIDNFREKDHEEDLPCIEVENNFTGDIIDIHVVEIKDSMIHGVPEGDALRADNVLRYNFTAVQLESLAYFHDEIFIVKRMNCDL